MPTKRTRISRNILPQVSPEKLFFLSDGLFGENLERESYELFLVQGDNNARHALWSEHREEILKAWIIERPGTRPRLWWRYDAPEPERKRLGGIGTPAHEVLNYVPSFNLGISDQWIDGDDVALYNGRMRHAITSERITNNGKWREGNFTGDAIDPSNPPRYESQAAYLARHGLLAAEEKRRLKPADFEPEIVAEPETEEIIQ